MCETRIKYLENKLPKTFDAEAKYWKNFENYSGYVGNGVYEWKGIQATNIRELFLMGILRSEGIKFKEI